VPTLIVTKVKSLIEREVFVKVPGVKKETVGRAILGKGYFLYTFGQRVSEDVVAAYVPD
jgi:hypothetical protein